MSQNRISDMGWGKRKKKTKLMLGMYLLHNCELIIKKKAKLW